MLKLYVQAPFATFRTFSAGSFRPSAAFMTPTAAYGLLLNLAGINSRLDDGKSPMTLMRDDLPRVRIALGIPSSDESDGPVLPRVQSIYQQLHNYPVGASGKDHAKNTMGSKYNITPVRRQFLVGLRALIAVHADEELDSAIVSGLVGEQKSDRFGLPFLGDNSFLPDVISTTSHADQAAFWFEKVSGSDDELEMKDDVTRLTSWIDRMDMSKTQSSLYAPSQSATLEPPETSWTEVGPKTDN
ncbi:MAG: type I-MYXAN CRISPR-associated protein Cas5/Cmx5/DevS [Planctomycetes bacterium]|nr:type I-MYXAN CRISPR-associated protein Cas5/Cmx5/DevS [Planctomycetota bacterium]